MNKTCRCSGILFPAVALMALYLAWRDRPRLRAVGRAVIEVGGWLVLAVVALGVWLWLKTR